MNYLLGSLAGMSLAGCLVSALAFFWGWLSDSAYQDLLLMASAGWFVLATWVHSRASSRSVRKKP